MPGDEHLHLVQVEVSLQAGNDLVELILLHHQVGLNWHIVTLLVKLVGSSKNVGKLQLPKVCVRLVGKLNYHQGASHVVHVKLAAPSTAALTLVSQ